MFGAGTAPYFEQLPELRDLGANDVRRALSLAYTDVLSVRDGLVSTHAHHERDLARSLRRLASALEVHAVLVPEISDEARTGSAFVAAEALSLRLDLPISEGDNEEQGRPRYRLLDRRAFQLVETGL